MKIGIKVGDIMTRDFVSVKPEISIEEAARTMIKKRVGSLILEQEKKLVGLVTERDILWAIVKMRNTNLNNVKVGDIANRKVITIHPSADLYEALEKMKKSKYRWLPVVIEGKITGFLTLKDIIKIEPSLFEIAREGFQIKEEQNKLKRIENRRNR